ncbi:B-cell linker protein-like [Neodiprion fabricii]|uniref:B-cell linker protein-like n=1 Tax=Neodiprion fabricii TaxID=2872261 RepID=UPI001ED962AF|nr:B-cell linker protein-like [Neodiprion fabricii]XP_046435103.1 B-cell linker protein-like [Neodiprion fabricii]
MSDNAVRERLVEKIYKFNTEDVVAVLLKNQLDHCCEDIVSARIDGEKLLHLTGKSNSWTNRLEPSVHRDLCEFVENLLRNPSDYLTDQRFSDEEFSPAYEEDYSSENEFWGSDFEDEGPHSLISRVDESDSSNEKEPESELKIYSNDESWTESKTISEGVSPESIEEIEPEENMYTNKSDVVNFEVKKTGLNIVEQMKISLAQQNFNQKPKIGPKPKFQIPNGRNAEFGSLKPKVPEPSVARFDSCSKFPGNERPAVVSQQHKKLPVPTGVNNFAKKTTPKQSPLGSEALPSVKEAREMLSRDRACAHARKPMQKPPVPPPPDKTVAKSAILLPKPPENPRICPSPLLSSKSADDSDDGIYEPIDERLLRGNFGQLKNGSTHSLVNESIGEGSLESIYHEARIGSDNDENYETPDKHVPEGPPVHLLPKKPIQQINNLRYAKNRLIDPNDEDDDDGYEQPISTIPPSLPRRVPPTQLETNSLKQRLPPGNSSTYPQLNSHHSSNSELSNRPLPSPPNRNRLDRSAEVPGSSSTQPFTERPWFHNVRREQAEALVRGGPRIGTISRAFAAAGEFSAATNSTLEGCFLVRPSSTNAEQPFTLVLWAIGRPYNIAIRKRFDGQYALGERKDGEVVFETIDALVNYYQKNDLVLKSKGIQTGTTRLTQTPQKKNDWTV